jgi:hypothetical protein
VNRKKILASTGALVLLLGTVATLWALGADYNRPNPLMDYVPQELGIYDTMYTDLDESACRSCHGNSLADRHHLTETVVRDRLCTPCHDIIPNPPGVIVYRNCTTDSATTGCHSWDSVYTNGWHHNTDLSGSENCTACHNPNLVAQISPFRSMQQYPPSVVTPTPFSCENCHWDQDVAAGPHPSTKHHFNIWGEQIPGTFDYGKRIAGNFDTHHMGFKGNVASQCYKCHSADPNTPSWDPSNPELIRYCMICHDVATLHILEPHLNGDVPHVGDIRGWEAVGFHAGGGGVTEPTGYRIFDADEQCIACHGDALPDPPAVEDCSGYTPAITYMTPTSGACMAIVTLRGQNFGVEQYEDSFIQMKKSADLWSAAVNVPAYSWTETQIEFEIPCWAFTPGNYKVRVKTACEGSNAVTFSLKDNGTLLNAMPDSGPCSTPIVLGGSGFGATRFKAPDPVSGEGGIARFVDFVASQGTYTATGYSAWSDTSVTVKFYNFFRDDSEPRNFVADGSDPIISKCDGGDQTWLGSYSVYFVTVYYTDAGAPFGNGVLDAADTITQVTFSDPVYFELTADPVIYRLNPDSIDSGNRLKVLGLNFGPYQTTGEVRVGKKAQALSALPAQGKLLTVTAWSNTQLKVKFKSPAGTTRYVWVEKDGVKSNFKKIHVN